MLHHPKQEATPRRGDQAGLAQQAAEKAGRLEIENQELTIYYSAQCPYIYQSVELVRKTCGELESPCTLIPADTLEKVKALSCVFNNWPVFDRGKFVTVNLLDAAVQIPDGKLGIGEPNIVPQIFPRLIVPPVCDDGSHACEDLCPRFRTF